MSAFQNFIRWYLSTNNKRLKKSEIPAELRAYGAPFYGLDSGSTFSLLRILLGMYSLSNLPEESFLRAEIDKINRMHKNNTIYCLMSKRIGSYKVLKLTDSEFEILKVTFPQLFPEPSRQATLNIINSNMEFFKSVFFLSFAQDENTTYSKPETLLYSYLSSLLNASDIDKNEKIILDDIVLANDKVLEKVLNDLKTNQRATKSGQLLPLLHGAVTLNQLREAIVAAIKSNDLRQSVYPNKVVKMEKGVMQDLGELSFQNHIVKELNKIHQKQEEELQPKKFNEDEALIAFLDECRKVTSLSDVSKTPVPAELKAFGKVFHGLKDITVYVMMVKLIKLDRQNKFSNSSVTNDYNIDAIYDAIDEHKHALQNDLVHNLIIRISSSEIFQITDQEFEALKQDARFLLLDSKEEFCQKVKANANAVLDKLAQIVYSNEEPVIASSNPLYKFAIRFIADQTAATQDFGAISEVLRDLKNTQRTTKEGRALPKLKEDFNSESKFIEELTKLCEECKIQNSITPDRLTYITQGKLQDLGELSLQNHLVTRLNSLAVPAPVVLPDVVSYTSLSNSTKAYEGVTGISRADASKILKSDGQGINLI